MKRSVNNRLATQFNCAMILHNIIFSTLFTWRSIFGPIHPKLAVFESYFVNLWINLSLLLLTEMSVIKVLMIFKWSWIVQVDEYFAAIFLLQLNLGYTILSQTARLVQKYIHFHQYFKKP